MPKSCDVILAMGKVEVEAELQELPTTQDIVYQQWCRVDVDFKGRVIRKVKLVRVTSSKDDFIADFMKQINDLPEHARRVTTQYEQMRQLRSSLQPKTEVTIQMDYSENYSCMYQDEISAIYYDKHQITIHSMVVHYIKLLFRRAKVLAT